MLYRYPLHLQISTLFIALILLISSVIGFLGYKSSRQLLESTSTELNARISKETLSEFRNLVAPAGMAMRLISQSKVTEADTLDERLAYLELIREALEGSPAISAFYIGYANGDFFFTRRLADAAEQAYFKAPADAAYLVQSIDDGQGEFIFIDAAGGILRRDPQPDYAASYDPRQRFWYSSAIKTGEQAYTEPYVFYSNKKVGSTISRRSTRGDAVAGADIQLETLGLSLARQKVTPGSQIVLADGKGQTIAFEAPDKAVSFPNGPEAPPRLTPIAELGIPAFAALAAQAGSFDAGTAKASTLTLNGESWHISVTPLAIRGSSPLLLISAIPDSELMANARQTLKHVALAVLAVILLAIPVTWLLARSVAKPLRQLAREADLIQQFEFSQPITVRSPVLEVNDLATTMSGMKRTIRRFLDISMAIAAENDFDRLLPRLLSETLPAAEAEAGILYLYDNGQLLKATALKRDGSALPTGLDQIDPAAAGPLLSQALNSRKSGAGELGNADLSALGLAATGSTHGIAVPLCNRQHQLVGAMLLLCPNAAGQAHLSFVEALSGSVAVSLESKELIKAQKALFEAFIQLIAGAIDAKSPYTGGHCARVPELTKMLARAACAEQSGPYAGFQLSDEDWEAVHVAAWLHDCGKVTTPEYVVDKATKLETLYDRIHEIRMRFEVLKRDAEIACLQAIAAGAAEAPARQQLAATLTQLDDDFAFVATCNEGGEFMAPEKIARLDAIAARTWQRTLDDRIGISHEEKARKDRTPISQLPVSEPLLADKPEHIFERQPRDRMPADNPWGIRMPVPELLYNKGQRYNLGVARGTLAEEERYKINEHIVQTLIMLSQLPFPKHLRNVPEIAAGHHEKMDGSGYPRRLTKDEMSPVARMMAIADIFEALTAVDRPYKKGKTLSEAIKIMSFMKKDQHIDPELFDLFLRSGAYREYAERYMQPEQIDQVDISAYTDPLPKVS